MWIIMLWWHISTEVNVKGSNMCCTSNAIDGTDDDMLKNGSEEVDDARNECGDDGSTDCEDGDSDPDW
jgi:hypothetical protein